MAWRGRLGMVAVVAFMWTGCREDISPPRSPERVTTADAGGGHDGGQDATAALIDGGGKDTAPATDTDTDTDTAAPSDAAVPATDVASPPADAAPTSPPPPDAAPAPPTPVPPPPARALLVVGPGPLIATDLAIQARLAARLPVDVVAEPGAGVQDSMGRALVIVSSSVSVTGTGNKFRDVPVPVMVLEPNLLAAMLMTSADRDGSGTTGRDETELAINPAAVGHPLAAGLSGVVEVYSTPWRLAWGMPAATATKIAWVVDSPDQMVIFAYTKGEPMVGGLAAGKRMGFFLHNNTSANLTPAAIALLDAAIVWMIQ